MSMIEYQVIGNENGLLAIFHKDNPDVPVSDWWPSIISCGVLSGKSRYYMVANDEIYGKHAIFSIDDPATPVSKWWKWIEFAGLINGQTHYYIAQHFKDKKAIFHISDPNQPISQWWGDILSDGVVQGMSDYYIAKFIGQYAIFHKDQPDQPISQWWSMVSPTGLVRGESKFCLVRNYRKQYAILYRDVLNNPITDYYRELSSIGLVNGTSLCYVGKKDESSFVQVFHIDDIDVPLYQLPIRDVGLVVYADSEYAIYIDQYHDRLMKYDTISNKSTGIAFLPTEMRQLIINHYIVDALQSNQLISQYMNYDFLPICLKDNKCYLFSTKGELINNFDNVIALQEYIRQLIVKEYTNPDIIRLY